MREVVELQRAGVRLACRDFGGAGPSVLLLHGLAGYLGEWEQTASWLRRRGRVWALDARGHGRSERRPVDVSPAAHADDVVFVIGELGLAPVWLIGQSLGGVTALLVAGRHPDLIRALILADASPIGEGVDYPTAAEDLAASLRSWGVPFASRAEAERFFGARYGDPAVARVWTDGLDQRDDGWWPRFEPEVMMRTLAGYLATPCWDQWDQIRCPILLVRADRGGVEPETAAEMVRRRPQTRVKTLPDAAHDLHLDRPSQWQEAVERFLDSLRARG